MATNYHIYSSNGLGGPVDYSTIVATRSTLTYDVGPLDYGSDWTFAVRAFDTVSGLEESNVDARVRILVSAAGADLAGLPNAPFGLKAVPTSGGGMKVTWAYNPRGQGAAPTNFHIYKGTPTVSYASPAATVSYAVSSHNFSATLTSLTNGATYQFSVRAYNASGEETNTVIFTAKASTSGPSPATNLASTILS